MLDPILERNATCPICKRFYHRLDINKNPIPDKENQRTEEELCQCGKGRAAREFRRQRRMELQEERRITKERREELLTLREKNTDFWKRKQGGDK